MSRLWVPPRGSVEDQAAAWYDLMQEADPGSQLGEAFLAWRTADPAHDAAYQRVERAMRRARSVTRQPALLALEIETLAGLARDAGRHRRRRFRGWVVAASLLLVVGSALLLASDAGQALREQGERLRYALGGQTLYRTGTGERLVVALSDGSTLTLNTRSRAVVRMSETRRDIGLLDGQALFDVARDPQRPFVVVAGDRRVTALGTLFDVRVSDDQVEVTLVEGRVAVETRHAEARMASARLRTELAPGEQFVAMREIATLQSEPQVRIANIERVIGWREGQILFENEPLREVIAEINRYSHRQLALAEPGLGELRISGAFNSGNPAAFIDMLTRSHLPLRIVEAGRERIVLGQRRDG